MEIQFKKYLNGTCNPEEFSEVLEAISTQKDKGKLSSEILELWEVSLKGSIENKQNSQLLDKIHHRIALEESKTEARQIILYRNLLKAAAVLIINIKL